jgi:PST family polysaccharide transporter
MFQRTVRALLQVLSVVGLFAPLMWWIGGRVVVRLFYGHEFAACGPVLFIHCLSSLAYLHGQVRSFVLVTTGRARYGAYAAYAGALINVLLNLWWIPIAGAQGAAWATAVAYYAVWFAGSFVMPGMGWLAWAQVRSLAAPLTLLTHWRRTLDELRAR